jgi:site-specific recombinase XerD
MNRQKEGYHKFVGTLRPSIHNTCLYRDVLSVIGKGNKERKIFITPAVKQALAEWLSTRKAMCVETNALFISRNNQRITTRAIQNIVKKHVFAAGLNPEDISAHKLRHTAATLMYKYGHVDIRSLQQILGHESIATTEIYTHVDEAQRPLMLIPWR